ncbi:hypothetical protein TRVL_04433 [Trypanosoma vivax]|nr:hypothetical protein TRVL_04433 [Trypanosoma vivax]
MFRPESRHRRDGKLNLDGHARKARPENHEAEQATRKKGNGTQKHFGIVGLLKEEDEKEHTKGRRTAKSLGIAGGRQRARTKKARAFSLASDAWQFFRFLRAE